MLLAEEVGGLTELIARRFPDSTVHWFQEPAEPAAGEFVVLLKQEVRRSDSRSHTLLERQYAIGYYASTVETALYEMESLSRYVMNESTDSDEGASSGAKPIRVDSFTITSAEPLENGLRKCQGTLLVQSREPIRLRTQDKIKHMEFRTTNN
ncbi:hypothetical protein [Paenibacillus timonensis]|uniref:hypothetical protein n=1 Tax=Paenibacillus timonensis TaxID=225915 RepID=UPI003F98013D